MGGFIYFYLFLFNVYPFLPSISPTPYMVIINYAYPHLSSIQPVIFHRVRSSIIISSYPFFHASTTPHPSRLRRLDSAHSKTSSPNSSTGCVSTEWFQSTELPLPTKDVEICSPSYGSGISFKSRLSALAWITRMEITRWYIPAREVCLLTLFCIQPLRGEAFYRSLSLAQSVYLHKYHS